MPSALELRAMQKEEKEHTKNKKKSKKATQEGKERRYPRTLLSQVCVYVLVASFDG